MRPRLLVSLIGLSALTGCGNEAPKMDEPPCHLTQIRAGVARTLALNSDGHVVFFGMTGEEDVSDKAASSIALKDAGRAKVWSGIEPALSELVEAADVPCGRSVHGEVLCGLWKPQPILKLVPVCLPSTTVHNALTGMFAMAGVIQGPGTLLFGYLASSDGPFVSEHLSALGNDVVGAAAGEGLGALPSGCAWKADGALACWGKRLLGDSDDAEVIEPLGHDVIQASVSRDGSTACALKRDGTVWCWGEAVGPQWGLVQGGLRDVQQLAMLGNDVVKIELGQRVPPLEDDTRGCAVKKDGTLWCWGFRGGKYGWASVEPRRVDGLPGPATDVSLGLDHTCAQLADQTVWCWGSNEYGQRGLDTTLNPATMAPLRGCDGL